MLAPAGTRRLLWGLLLALLACGASARADAGKALVVVGPVDPPRNVNTRAYIAEAERVAGIVERAGYRVSRLYHPHATWDRLRRHARGADLLVYYGHGNGYGWMGYTASDSINGLCLTDPGDPNGIYAGKGVPGGNADDLAGLGLAPHCTVALVHTCYAAGSSKLDRRPIDYQTATTRVMSYAEAFFRAGAAHYVAINYVGIAPDYISCWVSGQPPDMAFLQTMAGRRVRSDAGMLVVEERHRPKPRSPWVSACVSRPVQLASAPMEATDAEVAPAKRHTDTPCGPALNAVMADPDDTREPRDWERLLERDDEPDNGYAWDAPQREVPLTAFQAESHGPLQAARGDGPSARYALAEAWSQRRASRMRASTHVLRAAMSTGRSPERRSAACLAEDTGRAGRRCSLPFGA